MRTTRAGTDMIPVYAGNPSKSEAVGYVSRDRAKKWVDRGIVRGAKKGSAVQIIKFTRFTRLFPWTMLSPEGLRIITIAAAEHGTKCQGGLVSPR